METAKHQHVEQCPICGNRGHPIERNLKIYVRSLDAIVASEFAVCPACDFAYMVNPFDDATMANYYRANDQIRRDEVTVEEERHISEQIRFLSRNMHGGTVGRMLEIGPDCGAFLTAAQDTLGVRCSFDELNELACAKLRAKEFFNVHDMDAGDQHFDVVVLRHVLEHIVFPVRYLMEVRNKLSPGGFVFIEVPDCSSIDLDQTDGFCLEHVNYFSLTSMCRLLNRAGFSIVAYESAQTIGYSTTSNRVLRVLVQTNPHARNACDQGLDAWNNLLKKTLRHYDAIDSLLLRNQGKRTAFYGAGTHTLMFLANSRAGLPMVIYDKDPKKIGTALHGAHIVDAETIADGDIDLLVVMVTSYEKEVRSFLKKKGISKEKIYFLTEMTTD